MKADAKASVLRALQGIPGVGRSIAHDLWNLGVRDLAGLRDRDPKAMYDRLCRQQGQPVDRCLLSVLRCAVYFASRKTHQPELLKWWNWKDRPATKETGTHENPRPATSSRRNRFAARPRRVRKSS